MVEWLKKGSVIASKSAGRILFFGAVERKEVK
jgi:hypothetical protein